MNFALSEQQEGIRAAIAKAQHAIEHVAFVLVDHALFVALGDQVTDFLFRHFFRGQPAEAEQAKQQARRAGHDHHARRGDDPPAEVVLPEPVDDHP